MKKSRYILKYNVVGTGYDHNLHTQGDEVSLMYQRIEDMDTTNHPNWRRSDDAGGYFHLVKNNMTRVASEHIDIKNINGFLTYSGSLTTPYSWPGYAPNLGDPDVYGPIAYNAMKPTKLGNIFNSLYEVKDLPHMISSLLQRAPSLLENIGNAFIGQQFGWNPLLGDIVDVINRQQSLQKRVEWLLRNQGKWIDRECKLVTDISTPVETGWVDAWYAFEQSFTNSYYFQIPQINVKWTFKNIVWASAQFRYFLPEPPPGVRLSDLVKRAVQGNRSITLGNLYRAVPWSWMLDWAFRMSSLLDVLDDGIGDRLAARRFFIMRTSEYESFVQSRGVFRGMDNQPVNAFASTTVTTGYKHRVRGFPFFPPVGVGLTPMQYGLLGGLGLSKYG